MIKQIFSFGKNQIHKGCYVVIEGKDREACRTKMVERFGYEWAFIDEYYRLEKMKEKGMVELKI